MFDLKKYSFISLLIVCLFFITRAWAGSVLTSSNSDNLSMINDYTLMQDSGDEDSSDVYEEDDEGDEGDTGDMDESDEMEDESDTYETE